VGTLAGVGVGRSYQSQGALRKESSLQREGLQTKIQRIAKNDETGGPEPKITQPNGHDEHEDIEEFKNKRNEEKD
jgi:hypothetical protein